MLMMMWSIVMIKMMEMRMMISYTLTVCPYFILGLDH